MAMRVGRGSRLALSGSAVQPGKASGVAAALVPGLLVALVVGAGGVRADTLSDCKTGAPAAAVKACTLLVNAGPGREVELEARYYRAFAYARQSDYDNAEVDLAAIVKARPNDAKALVLRSDINVRRGRLEPALADLDAVIAANPSHSGALIVRGDLYTRKGDYRAAKADLDKAIALLPKHPRPYDRRGVMHRTMGDLDLALADHDQAVTLAPKEPLYLMNRAQLHVQRKAYDLAIADYDKVLSLNAAYPQAKERRQNVAALKGSQAGPPPLPPPETKPPPQVTPPGQTAQPPSPPPPGPADQQSIDKLFAEAGAHLKANNVDLAIATLTRILALSPNSARAFIERGHAFTLKNDLQPALADFTKALAIDARSVLALLLRARVLADLGDIRRGVEDCEAAVKLAPTDASGVFCRGVVRAKGRAWSGAIEDLTKAIDGKVTNAAAAHYWRGKSYLETDNYEAAGNDADRAAALDPGWASAVALKGSVLLAKGEVDQALDEFERALKMQSNNLDAVVGHSAALIAKTLQRRNLGKAGKE